MNRKMNVFAKNLGTFNKLSKTNHLTIPFL